MTDRGVAADVFVVPNQTTGLAQWAYAVDLGGNIYRISGAGNTPFARPPPDDLDDHQDRLARLRHDGTLCTPNRKFMFAPDVVDRSRSGTYILLVGSGDREKPLLHLHVRVRRDELLLHGEGRPPSPPGSRRDMGDLRRRRDLPATRCCSIIERNADNPTAADLADEEGLVPRLARARAGRDRPITVFGTTTFSTHTPTVPEPGSLRVGSRHRARLQPPLPECGAEPANGTDNRYEEITGGGLPPSPVAGQVILDDGTTSCRSSSARTRTRRSRVGSRSARRRSSQPKSLTYWYIEK